MATPTYLRRDFVSNSPMRSKLNSDVSNEGSFNGLSKSRSEPGSRTASFGKLGSWVNLQDRSLPAAKDSTY